MSAKKPHLKKSEKAKIEELKGLERSIEGFGDDMLERLSKSLSNGSREEMTEILKSVNQAGLNEKEIEVYNEILSRTKELDKDITGSMENKIVISEEEEADNSLLEYIEDHEEDLEDLRAAFEFDGFNARAVKDLIKKSDDWQEKVVEAIVLILTRGTKMTKASKKMSAEGKSIIKDLRAFFKIKESKPGSLDITLSRILICFPLAAHDVLIREIVKPICTLDGYPDSLCFPGANAMIKDSNAEYHELYVKWSRKFTKIIKGKDEDVERYAEISRASTMVPDSQKV